MGAAAAQRQAPAQGGNTCPQCGKPLRERTSGKGPFVGCTGYPACKYKRDGGLEGGAAAGNESRAMVRVSDETRALISAADAMTAAAAFNATVARLRDSGEVHLVTPATQLAAIPPFHAVSMTPISVNASKDSPDTYDVGGGKRALSKHVLDQIALASGVEWTDSQRIDDRSSPYYVEWQVRGRLRALDGRALSVMGSRSIDLRPGGADYEGYVDDAKRRLSSKDGGAAVRRDAAEREAQKQISVARKFILSLAESKAKNRAIRSLGMRTAYSPAELDRPFVVLALVQNLDPRNEDERRVLLAQAAGATQALFGPPEPRNVTPLEPEPADREVDNDPGFDPATGEIIEREPEPAAQALDEHAVALLAIAREEEATGAANLTMAGYRALNTEAKRRGVNDAARRLLRAFSVERAGALPPLSACLTELGWHPAADTHVPY